MNIEYKVRLHYQATVDKYSYRIWAYIYKDITLPFPPTKEISLIVDERLVILNVTYNTDTREFDAGLGIINIPELEDTENKEAEIKHLGMHLKEYTDKGWSVHYKDVER